ncbi:MAG: N-acetylornithine carbamoyltransferase [Deltaproteobacteria bacterium]|nr:N-acetylornithine carbamoyltransferase [Deltaproteobacteria bacterium]
MTPTLETRLHDAVSKVRQYWRGTRFLDGLEPGIEGTQALLDLARIYRAYRLEIGRMRLLQGRAVAGLFFDPSLRTHTSMEVAAGRLGAHFVHLVGGQDTWKMEFAEGTVMDGMAAEHVKEAAPVLSSYADVLAVRAFPKHGGRDETVIRAFARYAGAPLINLESALAHPCQGLADMLTLADLGGGNYRGKKVCLSWAPHPKPLPQAVPLSVVRAAILGGADLHVACPEGFDLDDEEMERAQSFCHDTGAKMTVTRDQMSATAGALAVYGKGWGARDFDRHAELAAGHRGWTIGDAQMESANAFLHCLPVRRNVIVSDSVIDGPKSRVIPQAANREPVQAAVLLSWML